MSQISSTDAYHMALDLIKKAGFVLDHVSKTTDTCYYCHPSRHPYLIRVSTHRNNGSPMGLNNVVSRVSFSSKERLYPKTVENRMRYAIGDYFLREPKPSKYKGKKGTWEGDSNAAA